MKTFFLAFYQSNLSTQFHEAVIWMAVFHAVRRRRMRGRGSVQASDVSPQEQRSEVFYLFRGEEFYKLHTRYGKSNLCIPEKGIARQCAASVLIPTFMCL
jgi:hypothetical protein